MTNPDKETHFQPLTENIRQDSKLTPRSAIDQNSELLNDVRYGQSHILKRLNKWKPLEELNIAKDYLKGRLAFCIELDVRPRINSSKHFGSSVWSKAKFAICHTHNGFPVWVQDFDVSNFSHSNNRSDDFMLIKNIEAMQGENFLPSPAWVCRKGDEEYSRILSGCFYSVTRGFVVGLNAPTSRKRRFLILCTAVNPKQFPCRMVKGTTEIVNDISNDDGKIVDSNSVLADSFIKGDLNNIGASLRFFIKMKVVGVGIYKFIKSDFEITDVLLGPFDL